MMKIVVNDGNAAMKLETPDVELEDKPVAVVKYYISPESGKAYPHIQWLGEPPKDGTRLYLK